MKLTREAFTSKIAELIIMLNQRGILCILDYAMRSKEEQARLFARKLSKCDGATTISAHQYPDSPNKYAIDLYLHLSGSSDIKVKDLYTQAHLLWQSHFGGDPMIEWDQGHFQMTGRE